MGARSVEEEGTYCSFCSEISKKKEFCADKSGLHKHPIPIGSCPHLLIGIAAGSSPCGQAPLFFILQRSLSA